MRLHLAFITFAACAALAACSEPAPDAPEIAASQDQTISIYSTRHYDSDRDLYRAFQAKTGIRVRAREGQNSGLLEAMKAEGESSPADIVIATDAGTLWQFQQAGLLQPVRSDQLEAAIPAKYREAEGHWFGLSRRARVVVYDPARHTAESVGEYGALAAPELKGEVCMRSSSNIYNLSLMAELIERWGEDDALEWARDVRGNFARQPTGGDTTQITSIAAGECSVALINHYYWVRMAVSTSADERAAAQATALAFPAAGDGTHVNITGAGVAAYAPNKEGAIAFLEFLASKEGQALLITETREFPMIADVPMPAGLEDLPDFVSSDISLSRFGENQAKAQTLYDRARWK